MDNTINQYRVPAEEAERAVAIFADDITATEYLVRKQTLGSMPRVSPVIMNLITRLRFSCTVQRQKLH